MGKADAVHKSNYWHVMGRFGEERRSDCRHLPPLRNSHGGMPLGIDQRPRFFSRASASRSCHSWQIGRLQYRVNNRANPCRMSSSLITVSPTLTNATVLP